MDLSPRPRAKASKNPHMIQVICDLVETYINPEQARSCIRIIAFSKRVHARNRTGYTSMRPTLRTLRNRQCKDASSRLSGKSIETACPRTRDFLHLDFDSEKIALCVSVCYSPAKF